MNEISFGELLEGYRSSTPAEAVSIDGFVEYRAGLGELAITSEPFILEPDQVLTCQVRRPMGAAAVESSTSPL